MLTKNIAITLKDLPLPPPNKTGWPWTEQTEPLPEQMPEGSEWPRISIVTPNYNYGHFLEETIRSVLLQGYPNLEYIIIDGGSTDSSIEIIKKYEPWLTYWVSEKDKGQAAAINKGFRKASGEILAWLNSDDLFRPSCLAIVSHEMFHRPKVSLVYGDRVVIDADSNPVALQFSPSIITRYHWILGGVLPQECCFWRKESNFGVGQLNQEFVTIFDHEFLMRIWQKYRSKKISYFLGMYRSTEGNITNRLSDLRKLEVDKLFADKSFQFKLISKIFFKHFTKLQYRFEQSHALLRRRVSVRRETDKWIWNINK